MRYAFKSFTQTNKDLETKRLAYALEFRALDFLEKEIEVKKKTNTNLFFDIPDMHIPGILSSLVMRIWFVFTISALFILIVVMRHSIHAYRTNIFGIATQFW